MPTPWLPPTPLRRSASNAPVCTLRALTDEACNTSTFGTGRHAGETFAPFATPRGVRYLRDRPHALNAELGQNHAQLPVTHTHTQQHSHQAGLWLYYMRGCSDLMWDMGRTLLVRNRCELAVMLQQRAAGNSSWADAVVRVARTLLAGGRLQSGGDDRHLRASFEGAVGLEGKQRSESIVAEALDDCAHGIYRLKKRGTPSDSKVAVVDQLINLNLLDFFSGALLAFELRDTLDTVQVANKCHEELSSAEELASLPCISPVEIWDVRSLRLNHSFKLPVLGLPNSSTARWLQHALAQGLPQSTWSRAGAAEPTQGGAGGSSLPRERCPMSADWQMCLACRGSRLERACALRCTRAHQGRPSMLSDELPGQVHYGTKILPHYVEWLNQTQNPLGKAVAWMPHWSPALRHFRGASRMAEALSSTADSPGSGRGGAAGVV